MTTIREALQPQLDTSLPLTAEDLERKRENIRGFYPKEQWEEILRARNLDADQLIGTKMVFFLVRDETKLQVLQANESEIDSLEEKYTFLNSVDGSLPMLVAKE